MDSKFLPTLNLVRRNTELVVCREILSFCINQNDRDERQRQATMICKTYQQRFESCGDYSPSVIQCGCLVCLFHVVQLLPLVGMLNVGASRLCRRSLTTRSSRRFAKFQPSPAARCQHRIKIFDWSMFSIPVLIYLFILEPESILLGGEIDGRNSAKTARRSGG